MCNSMPGYKIKMPKSDKRVCEDSQLMRNERWSKKWSKKWATLELTKATQELPNKLNFCHFSIKFLGLCSYFQGDLP